ncbi:NfeD family protein [Microbacterium gallinarum]|uniref:NfeD family protein n=1 Tax=Microbacterium gallinarum TaxID=2762209 RepID=A0ABR8X4F4_9MICO|nr:NfeD family protein [Microbacterium gallinarum]MBD8024195.1 NfeD family protein [Microbacterium gallinarum]
MELIQTIEQWAWIGWLVLILVFLVIEMLTLDFTFLMLSIGGLAGLGSDLLGAPIWLQVIVAGVVAAVLVLFLRPPLLRRLRRGEDPTPSNVDALIDLRGRVIATVSTHGGQVKLANGDVWTARSETGELEPGTPIHVSRIDGATAVVRSDAPTASPTEDPRA